MWAYPVPGVNVNPHDITFFDCECWHVTWFDNPAFVRGDAHKLPFKDESFQTAVLGDILEHVFDPYMVLSEACRVSKDKILATVPDEAHWSPALEPFKQLEEHIKNAGSYEKLTRQNTLEVQSLYAKCTDLADHGRLHKHLYHVRQFTEEEFIKLLDSTGLSYDPNRLWFTFGVTPDTLGCNFVAVLGKGGG